MNSELKQNIIKDKENLQKIVSHYNQILKEKENIISRQKKILSNNINKSNQPVLHTISRGGEINNLVHTYLGKFKISFYTANCNNSSGITASGKVASPYHTVAVDNKYWKFGTKFFIKGLGTVVAEDTGSAIIGSNRIDFCVENNDIANKMGIKNLDVWKIN